jgi:hypothetical protein
MPQQKRRQKQRKREGARAPSTFAGPLGVIFHFFADGSAYFQQRSKAPLRKMTPEQLEIALRWLLQQKLQAEAKFAAAEAAAEAAKSKSISGETSSGRSFEIIRDISGGA